MTDTRQPDLDWATFLPPDEWAIYRDVLADAQRHHLPFAIGGGFAFTLHANRWRYTQDVDLYIKQSDLDRFMHLLQQHQFQDYFDIKPYDRSWIYRAYRDKVIVDLIWQMANHRTQVNQVWIDRAVPLALGGLRVTAIAAEELIWSKLFVMQRDRCDWPDLLNVLNIQGAKLDWEHLLKQAGHEQLLLCGLLCVHRWLNPQQAKAIPTWVWQRLNIHTLPLPAHPENVNPIRLLDSRDWFGPQYPPSTSSHAADADGLSSRPPAA